MNDNTAVGVGALRRTTADGNTAVGRDALHTNDEGGDNLAVGRSALRSHVYGSKNIALGARSGARLVEGSGNIYIGAEDGPVGESGIIRIGTEGVHRRVIFPDGVVIEGLVAVPVYQ